MVDLKLDICGMYQKCAGGAELLFIMTDA